MGMAEIGHFLRGARGADSQRRKEPVKIIEEQGLPSRGTAFEQPRAVVSMSALLADFQQQYPEATI